MVRKLKILWYTFQQFYFDKFCSLSSRHSFLFLDTRIRYFVYHRYHDIKLPQEQVKDGSAFVLTPLPSTSFTGENFHARIIV